MRFEEPDRQQGGPSIQLQKAKRRLAKVGKDPRGEGGQEMRDLVWDGFFLEENDNSAL